MSIYDECSVSASGSEETRLLGHQLALSLYSKDLMILLTGELGAGKTTFAQGFATGMGVQDRVVSPTYALEQRYSAFTHIDLYRLTREQAQTFLRQLESGGITLIEWADRVDPGNADPHIHIAIDEMNGGRTISIRFLDEAVPDDAEIDRWVREVRMPKHIQAHSEKVAEVADKLAQHLLRKNVPLRPQALHAAARAHDLLRFVDFKTWNGDETYAKTSDADQKIWKSLKETYGTPHEEAAGKFLDERGYSIIGKIVRCHRGMDKNGSISATTIEQKLLAYADKRVAFDKAVTLDERFGDFVKRYGNGRKSDHHELWLSVMKTMEKDLFPEGPPRLDNK